MLDKRAEKLADILVDYSVELQKGDHLLVMAEPGFEDFIRVLEGKAKAKKAEFRTYIQSPKEKRALVEKIDKKRLKEEAKKIIGMAHWSTACIRVSAMTDPDYLKGIKPRNIAAYTEIVRKPFTDILVGDGKKHPGKKWNIVGYPCAPEAKFYGMSLKEYSDFIFSATNVDWKKVSNEMRHIKEAFDNAAEVKVLVDGNTKTELSISLKGRGGDLCDGKYNMPDGEVFYGPVEDSAQGQVYFPYKTIRDGNIVEGIYLEFKKGKIVNFDADKNKEFLKEMLAIDGAKRVGELGIGCNYGIKKYLGNLLFDEKIGGTVHMALGNSYKLPLDSGGGKNTSALHWDIVCDLRKINGLMGGQLFVDNKLVQENGEWRI